MKIMKMKKCRCNFCIVVFISLVAILGMYSCEKNDDTPTEIELNSSYTIGDTLVSQFIEEGTDKLLQQVIFEVINIGTVTDTIPYLVVKDHSNRQATENYSHEYFDVIAMSEINSFMNDFKEFSNNEPGKKLIEFESKYNIPMQFIVGGYIESEMEIAKYFEVIETIHSYYKNESLGDDHVKNDQIGYFLNFIFDNGIDVDDLLLLLSDRGFTLNDLMNKLGQSDFSTINSAYSLHTDTIGVKGFDEFISGLFNDNQITSNPKDTKKDLIKFIGKAAQQIFKDAGSSFSGHHYSAYFGLLYGDDTNPLDYSGALSSTKNIKWKSGANYDHIKVLASCDYHQSTDLYGGLYVSSAQIGLLDVAIHPFHHVSSEISSSSVNKGTQEVPIAQITTKVSINLTVSCLGFSSNYSDSYKAIFNAKTGTSIKTE